MSNRIIFLLVVASAVSIFSLWLVWKDGSHYVAMATRDEARHGAEIARAGAETDTTRLFGQRGFLTIATVASADTLTARAIGRAEFVWKEMDIPIWTAPDSLAGKIVVPKSMPDSGDVPYLAKINDSTFAWLWLPGTRVRSNVDTRKK